MSALIERLTQCLGDGLTQAGLARACGIKGASVSAWMSGKTKKIEGANLLRAAKYLDVNPEWLATGSGPMRGPATPALNHPPPPALPPDEQALLASFRALGAKDRARTLLDLEYKARLAALEAEADPPPIAKKA